MHRAPGKATLLILLLTVCLLGLATYYQREINVWLHGERQFTTEVNEYQPSFSHQAYAVKRTRYNFGVHPLHNPQRLHEVFEPMMLYLEKHIANVEFSLEASRNYAAYNKKLATQAFDFALPNPYQTLYAIENGYEVFAKMGDDENFRGIILVKKSSSIHKVTDLIGKAVSYPAPTALAATMMPQHYLQKHGVNVMADLDNRYVGSQESSIMNVYHGHTAAAATWPPPWLLLSKQRPELKQILKVIWTTEPLINNSLVVLPSVPEDIVKQVRELLLQLHHTEEGRAILLAMQLSQFEAANNDSYQVVRNFIKQFSVTVRPLKLGL